MLNERERKGRIEFFKDKKGEFRWHLKASNGKMIACCGEGYINREDCLNGLESVRYFIENSEIHDV
ncbi:MAG: YegP family protein [Candidatus Omnitrophota bacterium]